MLDSDVWISMADLRCHRRVQINEVRDPDRAIRKAGDDFQLSTHRFDVAANGSG